MATVERDTTAPPAVAEGSGAIGAIGATGAAWPVGVSATEVLREARSQGVEVVDVKFTDLLGTWQRCSLPLAQLGEDAFEEGPGFDGSSIRGFQEIHESATLLGWRRPLAATGTSTTSRRVSAPGCGTRRARWPRC